MPFWNACAQTLNGYCCQAGFAKRRSPFSSGAIGLPCAASRLKRQRSIACLSAVACSSACFSGDFAKLSHQSQKAAP